MYETPRPIEEGPILLQLPVPRPLPADVYHETWRGTDHPDAPLLAPSARNGAPPRGLTAEGLGQLPLLRCHAGFESGGGLLGLECREAFLQQLDRVSLLNLQ